MSDKRHFSYDFVLLDFDGLLVDTEPLHYQAYMQMIEEQGVSLSWDFSRFCQEAHSQAMGVFVFLEKEYPSLFIESVNRKTLYERKKKIYEELLEVVPLELMPGAQEFLSYLQEHQIPRAVVTNSPLHQIEKIKAKISRLQTIPLFVTREDYKEPKPSPEGFCLAKERLGMSYKRGIGFEDTKKGIEALLAAGLDAVWVGESSLQGESSFQGRVLFWRSLAEFSSLETQRQHPPIRAPESF